MSTRSANKRAQLRERDGDNCWLCGRLMKFDSPRRLTGATLDHVKPRALGGSNAIENLRLAHRVCNEKRGTAPAQGMSAGTAETQSGSGLQPASPVGSADAP